MDSFSKIQLLLDCRLKSIVELSASSEKRSEEKDTIFWGFTEGSRGFLSETTEKRKPKSHYDQLSSFKSQKRLQVS